MCVACASVCLSLVPGRPAAWCSLHLEHYCPLQLQTDGRISSMQSEAHLRADSSSLHVLPDHDEFNAVPLVRSSKEDCRVCILSGWCPLRSQCWPSHDTPQICLQVSKDWRLHITFGGGESVSMLLALQGRQSISRTHAARSALADNGQLPRLARQSTGTWCTSLMAAGWPLLATST